MSSTLYQQFAANALPRTRVGGLEGLCLTRTEWATLLLDVAALRARGSEPPPVFFSINGQTVSLCATDPRTRALFMQSPGLAADGMPAVFFSRLLTRRPFPERASTTDLFHDIARQALDRGASFYLLGGRPEVNVRAVANVGRLYPGLAVVGCRHGYFGPSEVDAVVRDIDRAAPDVLWVSIGVPQAQRFAIEHAARMARVGVIRTSGGLFDFLSGAAKRAPLWMQQAGLEWFYRMAQEPRRLFPRYARTNALALWLMLTQTSEVKP